MLCLMTELKYNYILASVLIGFLNRSKMSLSHVEGGINFLIKRSARELINIFPQNVELLLWLQVRLVTIFFETFISCAVA